MNPSTPAAKFHTQRPKNLIQLKWWHRLAYISRVLPRTLRQLLGELELPPQARLLDYGCADMPYRDALPDTVEYLGADIEGNPRASITLNADGTIPVADASMDAVISTQVLEHVADPALYVSECFRTMKPGGKLLLSTHGIMIYHRDPVDYWRWTAEGLERQLVLAGFKVERIIGVMGLAATGLQLFQDATFIRIPRPIRPLYLLILQGMIALADRLTAEHSRSLNSLVFVALASRPQDRAAATPDQSNAQ